MIFYFYIFIFLVAAISMGVASGMVARSFIKLARVVGLNEYLLSFLTIGVVTSLPEISIAIASVAAGQPIISFSNVIGANLANITLVLGSVAFISGGVEFSRIMSKKVFWICMLISTLPSFLIFNAGGINRLDGMLLLVIFAGFTVIFSADTEFLESSRQHVPYGAHYFSEAYPDFINLFLGLAIIIPASLFIVIFTSGLADYFSTNFVLFGIVLLGLATTLPELLFGMKGAIMNHPSLSMGNILASMVFNGGAIPGMVAILSPSIMQSSISGSAGLNAIFMLAAFALISFFSYSNSKITRLEGGLLISLYLLFLAVIFFVW